VLFLCAFSCDVPLVPGYRILEESREVNFIAGPPPILHIQGHFKLENIGNSDLSFVDVTFPEPKAFGRQNIRVELNGHEITLANLPPEYQPDQPDTARIPIDPKWERTRTEQLAIEYDLTSPDDAGSRITLGEDEFHLGSRGWFAALLPPKHIMSPYPRRPAKTPYTVRVPPDFLVLARGAAKGKKKVGGEIEYRFVLSNNDLPPFVVAGRYSKSLGSGGEKAKFWTLKPLPSDPEKAAGQLMRAWRVLEKDFGPLNVNTDVPHVVESPELRGHSSADETGPVATAFPGGVLVNPAALALGAESDEFLDMTTHSLAHDWFGDEMYPTPDAALGLGEGLPEYATIVIDEARNGPGARRKRIERYLQRYDDARREAAEKPLGVTLLSDPPDQRRIALAKAPLFFVALEDACGARAMQNGLKEMVELLRGQQASYDSLRSELEHASGKDLAGLFRVWLNQKGISQDFRERYQ